jgi:hypothetical protein
MNNTDTERAKRAKKLLRDIMELVEVENAELSVTASLEFEKATPLVLAYADELALPSAPSEWPSDSKLLDHLIEQAYDHKECDSPEPVYLSIKRGIKTDEVRPLLRAALKGTP